VEGEDPIELREAIESLAARPEEARRMGEAAREVHSRNYTVGAFSERIEEVYQTI
jgi:glycosyltransferase involved in cell wall biosynthesis